MSRPPAGKIAVGRHRRPACRRLSGASARPAPSRAAAPASSSPSTARSRPAACPANARRRSPSPSAGRPRHRRLPAPAACSDRVRLRRPRRPLHRRPAHLPARPPAQCHPAPGSRPLSPGAGRPRRDPHRSPPGRRTGRSSRAPACSPSTASSGGHPAVWLHAYSASPPVSFVLPFHLRRLRAGAYGVLLRAPVCRALGRWPRLRSFEITLGRRYRSHGVRRSYLSAQLPAAAALPRLELPAGPRHLSLRPRTDPDHDDPAPLPRSRLTPAATVPPVSDNRSHPCRLGRPLRRRRPPLLAAGLPRRPRCPAPPPRPAPNRSPTRCCATTP